MVIKTRKVRQLKRSCYLEKIKPIIPKNEKVLNIQFNIEAINRVVGYVVIPLFAIFPPSVLLFLEITPPSITYFLISSILGIIIELSFVLVSKKGYKIKMLVFTNVGIHLFDNKFKEESVKFSEMENLSFQGYPLHVQSTKSSINFDLYFKMDSFLDSLKFLYFILNYYCNPKVQIKNRLIHKKVPNVEIQLQNLISKSKFKISNERLTDIQKRKGNLLIKYVIYEILTFFIMFLLIFLVYNLTATREEWFLFIMVDILILIIGGTILIGIPITLTYLNKSFKRMNYLPDSNFKVCPDGIKAISDSGDIWIPFEENLIIGAYDTLEKIFSVSILDGVGFVRYGEKTRISQIGPVEDYKYFKDIIIYHYLKWLEEKGLLLNEDNIKERYILSDPIKKSIAEKIMLEEELVTPDISTLPSFSMDSEKAIFKYPKVLYRRYITEDEKIYHIHHQATLPPSIKSKILLQLTFIIIFSISALILYYLQYSIPSLLYFYTFLLIPVVCLGLYLLNNIITFQKIKRLEVIFTESKIIFKQRDWLYPLSYHNIKIVYKISENEKKRYYRYLSFLAIKRSNIMTLHGISFDSPIIPIIESKCKVQYSDYDVKLVKST
ncbi:MAG: hypothetical protein ACFFCV_12005 [Promethearchaeota archaeon]